MDIGARIDPELASVVAAMGGSGQTLDAEQIASSINRPAVVLSDEVERTEHLVPGRDGDPAVPVRVHRPKGAAGALPGVYDIHGGGYIGGSYDDSDVRFDTWCPRLQYVGVSVDYRLAPETPYPGPLEDCYAGLQWTFEHAAELGIDPARIGISGFSAGGGLAAALALLARDRGGPDIAFQMLVYPMIDDTMTTPTSGWDVPIWNPASNESGWKSYLGAIYGDDDVPYTAAPSRALDLSNLPPAFVQVGALDGFCDENIVYAQRLNQAGVALELHVYPGAPHGFDGLGGSAEIAKRARRHQREWLTRQLTG
jgi:acetyl esterase/lipase